RVGFSGDEFALDDPAVLFRVEIGIVSPGSRWAAPLNPGRLARYDNRLELKVVPGQLDSDGILPRRHGDILRLESNTPDPQHHITVRHLDGKSPLCINRSRGRRATHRDLTRADDIVG